MKTIIEFSNKEEAQEALNMISAYLGTEAPKAVTKETSEVVPPNSKSEPKEEKKVPATRAKDSVKKDAPKKASTKPKAEPKPEEEEEDEAGEIDQATLTQIAKDAVARTDRATVKDVISEYGEKISVVDPADYGELAAKLKELE